MTFTVIAECGGMGIYNRRPTPRDALLLAAMRVREGAEKVMVYDEQWQFIGASALAEATRDQDPSRELQPSIAEAAADVLTLTIEPYATRSGVTFALQADAAETATQAEGFDADNRPAKTGRVRVFRATARRNQPSDR